MTQRKAHALPDSATNHRYVHIASFMLGSVEHFHLLGFVLSHPKRNTEYVYTLCLLVIRYLLHEPISPKVFFTPEVDAVANIADGVNVSTSGNYFECIPYWQQK